MCALVCCLGNTSVSIPLRCLTILPLQYLCVHVRSAGRRASRLSGVSTVVRDQHTLWVPLLFAVVAMVRHDERFLELNAAEEEEQRARCCLPARMKRWVCGRRRRQFQNQGAENVPPREYAPVAAFTTVGAMLPEQLMSCATFAVARDPAMAIGRRQMVRSDAKSICNWCFGRDAAEQSRVGRVRARSKEEDLCKTLFAHLSTTCSRQQAKS